MKYLPPVSISVIGYNEAKNLNQTFTAIRKINYPTDRIELIYIDSGSSDNSIGIAKLYCDKYFIENQFPTAARNRNRGLIECKNDIIHFIDGDIIIDPDYLKFAVEKLLEGEVANLE